MEFIETKLTPPEEFPFPFTPYAIQKNFMRSLYETLEEKKLGIFESPTGTGKSMSLICGSLKWLLDSEKRTTRDLELRIQQLETECKKDLTSANWLDEYSVQAKTKQEKDFTKQVLNEINKKNKKILEMEERAKKINEKIRDNEFSKMKQVYKNKKKEIDFGGDLNEESKLSDSEDYDVLLDNYDAVDDFILREEKFSDSESDIDNKEKYISPKIILCSRTHSQLSQLVKEIQKSPYNDLKVRVVTLASRQNYCINSRISNLKYLPLITEKCLELHKKKKGKATKNSGNNKTLKKQKTSSGCPYYEHSAIENLKLKIVTEILDVEHLVTQAKQTNACPYYASRHAVDDAQVIVLPYNTLLHKSTREACGINLRNSVVIIDEAHNLIDTMGNIHGCSVSGQELSHSLSLLTQYRDKYSDRFSAINLLHLNQLIFINNKLLQKLGEIENANKECTTVETLTEFVLSTEIDTINFYKILEFVTKSNIATKIRGFVDKYNPSVVIHKKQQKGVSAFLKTLAAGKEVIPDNEKKAENEVAVGNPLLSVLEFIKSLTNHCIDGRIVCIKSKTKGSSSLKYLLLNPASYFTDVVREARSVILAGGTMRPFSEFTDQLFYLAGGQPDRVNIFTCDHIVPPDNILPIVLSSGPSGKELDFSFRQRNDTESLNELGRLLINICNVVPAGVVCFFPSYEYEGLAFRYFEKTDIVNKLSLKKEVLREPKKSNEVDKVLEEYGKAVKKRGAILFSVVGGKLSEGLNFNDDLGRCVVVVGMPYPNFTSPELQEKIKYLNEALGSSAGKTYCENLCMKAVNQSIGRSIRHKDDYAAVLLLDRRYSRPRSVEGLPGWIRKSLRIEPKFGPTVGLLAKFFASKRKKV